MKRTEILNELIKKHGYTSYLEIGLGNGANFSQIACANKTGVDPEADVIMDPLSGVNVFSESSDSFFDRSHDAEFDLIFIDGDHNAEQVERDILNSWKCLNKGGRIVIHDIKPLDEVCQRVPRETVAWTGNVWRAWYGLKNNYPKLKTSYIEERVGLGVIEKSRHKIDPGFIDWETEYQEYHVKMGWR